MTEPEWQMPWLEQQMRRPEQRGTDGVSHGKESSRYNRDLHDLQLLLLNQIRPRHPEQEHCCLEWRGIPIKRNPA